MSATALPYKVKLFLGAHAVSIAGLGAQVVVFALVALERYGTAGLLAALVVARAVGLLCGFPVAGWLVARFGALRCAAACHTVFALWATAMGVLSLNDAPPWTLMVVTFAAGVAMAADSPARRAGAADLAGPGAAVAALSWSASATWAGRLAGAALGAACWAIAPWAAFAVNAVTYLVPAWLFLRWRHDSPAAASVPSRPAPLRAARHLVRTPDAATTLAATALGGLVVEFGVLAALVVASYRMGSGALSLLEALLAAGAVAAGVAGARARATLVRNTATGWAVAAVGAAAVAAPWFLVVAAGLAVCSAGVAYAAAMTSSTLVGVRAELRGDALAAFGVLQWATSAVAAPLLVALAGAGLGYIAAVSVVVLAAAAAVAGSSGRRQGATATA